MAYRAELDFLRAVLHKLRLQTSLLRSGEPIDCQADCGLRRLLGREEEYERTFREVARRAQPSTIYNLRDPYLLRYVILRLPDKADVLLIGPYLEQEATQQMLLEEAARLRMPPNRFRQIEDCYSSIPILPDERWLAALVDSFGERLWGSGEAFAVVDINQELSGVPAALADHENPPSPEETELTMKMMEERYAYENELMNAVRQGQSHKAGLIFKSFTQLSFQQRLSDQVRNMKNYCIIMNTLLRKAAEQGGVHPVYLDRMSSAFAQKIEQLSSQVSVGELMEEMFRSYCRLVRRNSMQQYSPPVQKAIIHIDSDLTADLSLKALAEIQNINASYLSSLFRRETGQTVTDHVNHKRIDHAAHLLRSTRLQIQTVAQYSGIPDVNYFSKIFKKYTGMTPKEFRETL